MPFPLHRLHYDLQKRLGTLVSPSELYKLHNVIGDSVSYLHPPQLCHIVKGDCYLFQNKHGVLQLCDDRTNYCDKNNLVYVEKLTLRNAITETDLKTIHAHALLNIKKLSINGYFSIDASLLRRVASLCSTECRNLVIEVDDVEDDVNAQLIFALFPNLKSLNISVSKKETLLQDLLNAKVTGLESLCIQVTTSFKRRDVFSNIGSKSVYEFCQAQSPNFSLQLKFYTNNKVLAQAILEFLKPYFHLQGKNESTKIGIEIYDDFESEYCGC